MGIIENILEKRNGVVENILSKPKESSAMERLKAGFGGEEAKSKIVEPKGFLEGFRQKGLLGGVAEMGKDVLDVIGPSIPLAGGIIGGAAASPTALLSGPVGPAVGAGIGVAAGEGVKQTIGQLLGVRKDKTPMQEFGAPLVSGATTALTAKIFDVIAKPAVKIFQKWLPEKLYGQVFKQEYDDFISQIKPEALVEFQKKDPAGFAKLVTQGIIKTGKNGEVVVNPTLAKEALDAGLKGSPEFILKQTYMKQLNLESQIKELISPDDFIKVPNKSGYLSALKDLQSVLKKYSYGTTPEKSQAINEIIKDLSLTPKGQMRGTTALELRRLLDSMRVSKSFVLDPNLSPKQEGLKTLANNLRGNLSEQIPGLKEIMNQYRFNIEAFNSLAENAIKRNNAKLINFTDIVVGGGGLAGGFPGTGVGAATAIRAFQQPFTLTHMGATSKVLGDIGAKVVEPFGSLLGAGVGTGSRDLMFGR